MVVATLQILNPQMLFNEDHRPVLMFPGLCRPADKGPEEGGESGDPVLPVEFLVVCDLAP